MSVLLKLSILLMVLVIASVQIDEPSSASGRATYRVAVVQLDSSCVGDFQTMEEFALLARREGAELVVFPEASVFGWLNPIVFTEAASIPGRFAAEFCAIAERADIWVAAGLAERGPKAGPDPNVYYAYDSAILVNPEGKIVLHHRKHNVLVNSFNPNKCPEVFGPNGCSYSAGSLSDIATVQTPFGRTAILVCADAYTYDTSALQVLKELKPELVIVTWGVAAGAMEQCGTPDYNAADYAAAAAKYLGTAYVVGANATWERVYGRYLPSWYCGSSGFATASGEVGGAADTTQAIAFFDIPYPASVRD